MEGKWMDMQWMEAHRVIQEEELLQRRAAHREPSTTTALWEYLTFYDSYYNCACDGCHSARRQAVAILTNLYGWGWK